MLKVLEPASLCGMELHNRFVRSATMEGMADPEGAVTGDFVKAYEDLAAGKVGLIVTSAAYVSIAGKSLHNQVGIHNDEMIAGLRRVADVAHRHGSKIVPQLSHAGGMSSYLFKEGKAALAPSVIKGRQPQRELTEDDLEQIIEEFALAAVRSRLAGFDGVQLHGGHGTLLPQLLSPHGNFRQDRWGGSLANRCRFHLELIRRVRAAVGADYPLMMKFGVVDDKPEGLTLDDGIATLKAMAGIGLNAVEISGGMGSGKLGYSRVVNDDINEDVYYRERTAAAKRATSIPVIMVGGIRYLETAEEILDSGDADFISISRPLVREPDLIRRWTSGDYKRARCISCNKCITSATTGDPLECGEDRRIREEQGAASS
ncbi:MAG: NADH:flavin oxidoreductase [Dehalococcoidia bacterium]|nr:NADH:flavin oxidoreductase [Dehalococcoidia bacterium]